MNLKPNMQPGKRRNILTLRVNVWGQTPKRQNGQVYTLYNVNWFLVCNKEYLLFLWSIRARYFATIRVDGVLARKRGAGF